MQVGVDVKTNGPALSSIVVHIETGLTRAGIDVTAISATNNIYNAVQHVQRCETVEANGHRTTRCHRHE